MTYCKGKYNIGIFDNALKFVSWINVVFKLCLIKKFARLKY